LKLWGGGEEEGIKTAKEVFGKGLGGDLLDTPAENNT